MTDILKAAHFEVTTKEGKPVPFSDERVDLQWQLVHRVGHRLGYLPDMLHLDYEERAAIQTEIESFNERLVEFALALRVSILEPA